MNISTVVAVVLTALLACSLISSAAAADIGYYAEGDSISISGSAPGSQSTGLEAWVLGPNYWSKEHVETESDGTYEYTLDGALTDTLSPGQYFVIIQHPMENGIFDVYTEQSGEQTLVVSNGGGSFIIGGPGSLNGQAAAYALMNLLNSPYIDDTYSSTEFYIESPWIKTGDEDSYPTGTVMAISGTTNLASGERLLYSITPVSSEFPSKKTETGVSYTTGMSGTVYVESGATDNTWTASIDTSGMDPGTYLFTIADVGGDITAQQYITLYVPSSITETVLPTGTSTLTEEPQQTTSVTATAPEESGPGLLPITTALVLAAVLVFWQGSRKRER